MASTTVQPSSSKNSTGAYVFGMSTVYPMKMSGAGIIIMTAVLVFLVCLIIILKIIHLTWTPGGKRKKKSSGSEVPWLKRMSMRLSRRKKSPKDITDNDATDRTVSMTLSEKESESTRSETPTVTANNNKRMSTWSVVSHVGKVAFGKKGHKASKKERRATIKEKHERKESKKDKEKSEAKDLDEEKGEKEGSMKEKRRESKKEKSERRESKKEKSERKLSKKKSKKDRMSLSKHLSTLPGEVPPIIERKFSIP